MVMRTTAKLLMVAALALGLSACDRPGASVTSEGAKLVQEKGCVACHGTNGKGTGPTFPNIGGQWRAYLLHQLEKFRSGERQNAIMNGQAAQLTDHEIAVLSTYYSQQ